MPKIFDKLFLAGPMSLGDSLVYNGIVHYFADRCQNLHLPINTYFRETLIPLYRDFTNIVIVDFPPNPLTFLLEEEYCTTNNISRVLRCPVFAHFDNGGVWVPPLWDQQLYSFYEIPFYFRYSNFRVSKSVLENSEIFYNKANPTKEPYILVHRGFGETNLQAALNIENSHKLKIIEINSIPTNNMLDYIALINNAVEIHCLASSFHCLVDSLTTSVKGKKFYHRIRKNSLMMCINNHWNGHNWNIIEYPQNQMI